VREEKTVLLIEPVVLTFVYLKLLLDEPLGVTGRGGLQRLRSGYDGDGAEWAIRPLGGLLFRHL
jgi:hypothetical protein